jgi:hypothetical protein
MVSGASGAARSQKAQSWKGPNTIGTRERAWQKRQKARRDVQRRTRRSASTIGSAAPDTIIGRAAADRAGARPYRATPCENASPETPIRQYADPPTRFPCRRPILSATTSPLYARRYTRASSPRCSLYDPRRGSNPRRLCLTNAYFGGKRSESALYL